MKRYAYIAALCIIPTTVTSRPADITVTEDHGRVAIERYKGLSFATRVRPVAEEYPCPAAGRINIDGVQSVDTLPPTRALAERCQQVINDQDP